MRFTTRRAQIGRDNERIGLIPGRSKIDGGSILKLLLGNKREASANQKTRNPSL